jgi:acyl-CoA thioesterase-2
MPEAPPPDTLEDWEEQRARALGRRDAIHSSAVELRLCDGYDLDEPDKTYEPRQRNWVRVKGPLPDDPVVHVAMLVYLTDRALLMTAARAHGLPWDKRMSASLDHAVWIHRPIARGIVHARRRAGCSTPRRVPVGHAARSLIFGGLYTGDGVRFASVVQEGLIRATR